MFVRRGLYALALTFLFTMPLRATCGSAACFLVTGTTEGVASEHSLAVDFSVRVVDQDRKLSGTHEVDEVLTPKVDFENHVLVPDHHREIRTVSTVAQLDLAYGVTSNLSVLASIPVVVDKQHEHFDDVGDPDEHFTNQDGTRGFGDVQLGARYAWVLRGTSVLIGSLAVKLPTGAYKLLDGEGAINEPTIQPGTGSYDAIASVGLTSRPHGGAFEWFASTSARANRENDLEYRIGDEAVLNLGARFALGEKVDLSLQANGRKGDRDRYLGSDVPSTGSTTVYATPGIRFKGEKDGSFYAFIQLPVCEKVNESQIAPRTGYVFGYSRTF